MILYSFHPETPDEKLLVFNAERRMATEPRRNSSHSVVYDHHPYREQILTEQVRQLYALAPVGFVATLMNSVIVFFIMREVMEERWIVAWMATVVTVLLLRIGLVAWFWSAPL